MDLKAINIEIMAPVGSYESLMAAIQGRADAVYFGIEQLNMRSRSSNNFTFDDLKEISEICKRNKVKTYVTLNTVIYDDELKLMQQIIDKAKENDITAVIVSDMAAFNYASSKGVEIHASTQCNITNIEAVKFYAQFADVMVTARELSLKQVAQITKQIEDQNITGPSGKLVQIEVFAHGALCMAVSGKCYLSLDNMNYSANRGACLQLCRRKYKVTDVDEGLELEVDGKYIMSPKDLCTIGFLDKILKAGVQVLKIEGRGRSPEYVKTVTRVYKEAVKAIELGDYSKENIELWTKELSKVFNRGFWDGYYLGRKIGEWTERYGSQATHKKMYIGKVTNYFTKLGVAEITVETNEFESGDEYIISGSTTGVVEGQAKEIHLDLKPVQKVSKSDVFSLKVPELVRRGDKLYKVYTILDEF